MSSKTGQSHDFEVPRPPRLGKASLILGIVSPVIMLLCGCLFPLGVLAIGQLAENGDSIIDYVLGPIILIAFLASPIMSLTGFCLGVAGLFRKACRGKSALGILLNLFALSVFTLICLWWSAAIDDMIAC